MGHILGHGIAPRTFYIAGKGYRGLVVVVRLNLDKTRCGSVVGWNCSGGGSGVSRTEILWDATRLSCIYKAKKGAAVPPDGWMQMRKLVRLVWGKKQLG